MSCRPDLRVAWLCSIVIPRNFHPDLRVASLAWLCSIVVPPVRIAVLLPPSLIIVPPSPLSPRPLRALPSPELIRVATCAAGPRDHDGGGLKAVACHPTPGAGAFLIDNMIPGQFCVTMRLTNKTRVPGLYCAMRPQSHVIAFDISIYSATSRRRLWPVTDGPRIPD